MQKIRHIITQVHLSLWGIIVELSYVILLAALMYCITMIFRLFRC